MLIKKLFYPIMGVYILLADILAPALKVLFMDKNLPWEIDALIFFFLTISHVRLFFFTLTDFILIGFGVVFYLVWLSCGLIMNRCEARSHFIFLSVAHLAYSVYFLFIFNINSTTIFDENWWIDVASICVSALFLVVSLNISDDESIDSR